MTMKPWKFVYQFWHPGDYEQVHKFLKAYERTFGLLSPDEHYIYGEVLNEFLHHNFGPNHVHKGGWMPLRIAAWLSRN